MAPDPTMTALPEYVGYLPHLNASFNMISTILIWQAVSAARLRNRKRHIRTIVAALVVSSLFLVSYLTYHAHIGNVAFAGVGGVRYLYFAILISHVLMAAVALPMILMTAWRGFRSVKLEGEGAEIALAKHRKMALKTALIWLYVSVTGVVVYLFAFWIYPS
ncbi:MAG: DUF420 domain-containing protein [Magnetococcales bacterium]|nr:DUF420 domain-containing protein [Magnetococcales bacterium]